MGGEDGRAVGADAEERHLGQVDLPGDPHREVQAGGQQRENDRDVRHLHRVRAEPVGQQVGRGQAGRDQRQAAFHARFTVDSPKIPVGLIITMMANTTNVTRSEYPEK